MPIKKVKQPGVVNFINKLVLLDRFRKWFVRGLTWQHALIRKRMLRGILWVTESLEWDFPKTWRTTRYTVSIQKKTKATRISFLFTPFNWYGRKRKRIPTKNHMYRKATPITSDQASFPFRGNRPSVDQKNPPLYCAAWKFKMKHDNDWSVINIDVFLEIVRRNFSNEHFTRYCIKRDIFFFFSEIRRIVL